MKCNCEDIETLLSGYLDGELTQSDRQRVEVLMEDCEDCAKTFEEMKKNLLICPANEMIDKLSVYAETGVDEIIVSSSFGQNQKDLIDP